MTEKPWFGVLGALVAGVDGGGRMELGGRKQRELLGMLLLNANRCTPAGAIADGLWGGKPPASAEITLRTHISHLRRRLATIGAQDALVTRRASYGLFVSQDQVDATQFEHLTIEGQKALDLGEFARAAQLLAEGLNLWRGSVLEDLGPPEFATTEAARLEELRRTALEHRIDADLALGQHHAVIAELERLIVEHPFRERLHCRLMLAMYRSGRQADALAVSARVRRLLADELGVDPSPALSEMETAILRHDPDLAHTAKKSRQPVMPGVPPGASTKYRPPTSARAQVLRARLIDALRAAGGRRLTVIHGPAGFGKTTLAAQWRDVLIEQGVGVAWLTIDSEDNNVAWFLAHLIEAVRIVRPALAEDLRKALEEKGEDAGRFVLTALINDVDEVGTTVAVMIHDWHRITDPATIEAMAYLLDHASHHLQVVVTSRTRAGLPLGRMRVRDELAVIDSAALRFDTSEARSFLVDICGLDLDATDVAHLEQSTDGWVAALQLASLSLRDCDDPAALIRRITGRHHAIAEYLAENVLDKLDSAMLDFLMATSVTERISGDLASALIGGGNGRALLEEAEDRDLFLRRLDDEREWFRYHHLFAEFLQRRLARDHPERIPSLHAAASRWFTKQNMLSEAVDHALAAGDEEFAIELTEQRGVHLTQNAQMGLLLAVMSKLPPHIVSVSPRLQVLIAWANALLQRPTAALAALAAVESAIGERTMPTSEVRDLRVEADVIRATMKCFIDRLDGVDELVYEALSRPDTLPAYVVASASCVASVTAIHRFDFDGARELQDWADPYHRQTSGPFTTVFQHCLVGMAAHEQLDLDEAQRRYREALRVARGGGTHSHAVQLASALLGSVLYVRGQVDEAERLIEDSYQSDYEGGIPEFMIARYVLAARIKAIRGDRAAAAERLDAGACVAAAMDLPRLQAQVDQERSRLGLPITDPPDGDALPDDGTGHITAQLRDETRILGLLGDDPDLGCQRAQEWVQRLEPQGRPHALLQSRRLLAVALDAAGRTEEAKQIVAEVAAQCAELGMARFLLDGGPRMVALVAALRDDLNSGRWNAGWPAVSPSFLSTPMTGVPREHSGRSESAGSSGSSPHGVAPGPHK